jgi:HlyD family secretion protein
MARLTPLHLIPALIAATSHAGEMTVEKRPFLIEQTFQATVIPADGTVLLKLEPQAWIDFQILEIADHGATVAEGDVLARFDSAKLDEKIEDARNALAKESLELKQAELQFATFQQSSSHKLDALRRTAEIAAEELEYFTKVRRKAMEESAAQSLKRSQQILENQREELKQLSKMYEDDDITEDTEEIILIRQQDSVAAAEFALRMENLDHQRTLHVALPREASQLEEKQRDSALRLKSAEQEIPRSLEIQKLELDAKSTAFQRSRKTLAELEKDHSLLTLLAPAAGTFYHGAIQNGRWLTGDVAKWLKPGGKLPPETAYATFIPQSAELSLVAFVDEATSRSISSGQTGTAVLVGREDLEIPVKLLKLSTTPDPDGNYRADLSALWPDGFIAAAGSKNQVRLISYQQPAAIVIPHNALHLDPGGWRVEVKLADGKTERRPVKRGRANKEESEILSGLEAGQVIITPP